MGFALSENKSRFTSEILHHLGACACRSNAQASIPSGSIEKLNLLRELQDHWDLRGLVLFHSRRLLDPQVLHIATAKDNVLIDAI